MSDSARVASRVSGFGLRRLLSFEAVYHSRYERTEQAMILTLLVSTCSDDVRRCLWSAYCDHRCWTSGVFGPSCVDGVHQSEPALMHSSYRLQVTRLGTTTVVLARAVLKFTTAAHLYYEAALPIIVVGRELYEYGECVAKLNPVGPSPPRARK